MVQLSKTFIEALRQIKEMKRKIDYLVERLKHSEDSPLKDSPLKD